MWNNRNNYGGGNRQYNDYRQNNNQNRGYQNNQPQKKHSGCKEVYKDGVFAYMNGWNYSKQRGLISFLAIKSKNSGEVHTSKSGKRWVQLFVRIFNKRTLQTVKCSGLYDLDTHKLILNEQGMVANPKAPNGGYFGKFGS